MTMLLRFFLVLLILCVMVEGLGCGKKREEEIRKEQTVANQPLPDNAFKASISVEKAPSSLKANSISNLEVKVKNISNTSWPSLGQSDGKYIIQLGYHWLDKNGKAIIFEGRRTPLPHDLKPNEEIILNASIGTPEEKGEYILELEMVQELVAWFRDKGSKAVDIPIKVE
jgi:hypothetical protein